MGANLDSLPLRKLRTLDTEKIIALVSVQAGIPAETLLSRGYKGAEGGVNQRQIGEKMGIDYSAVSIRRKRFMAVMEKDHEIW